MNFSSLLRSGLSLFVVFATTCAFAEEAPVPRVHQVNAPVGLVIRSKPSTKTKRVGSLEEGLKVTLAGKPVEGDKTKVIPVVYKDVENPEVSWIQITKPQTGFVLYRAGGASSYEYLVPAK